MTIDYYDSKNNEIHIYGNKEEGYDFTVGIKNLASVTIKLSNNDLKFLVNGIIKELTKEN